MATKLEELTEKLDAKRQELHTIFAEAGEEMDLSKVKILEGKDDISRRTEVKKRNDELTEIAKERDALVELQNAADNVKGIGDRLSAPANRVPYAANGNGGDWRPEPKVKSFRQILEESTDYQAFLANRTKTAVIELTGPEFKTLMTLTTINNPPTRRAGIIPSAQDETTVMDMILSGTTDNNALTYMEETTFTNAAVEVAEGAAKPESALAFTERTDNVRKIATWIPATSELLADVSGIESYIRGRLGFMVERRLEGQIILGDGTAPNISGIMDRSGIQTQAKGVDPTPDAIYKALTKVRVTGQAEPTGVVIHPNDWQEVRLLTTTDGIYLWGSPSDAGPERIWGLPIRQTPMITEGTALVGAFTPFAQWFEREGLTITLSTEHSTYFTENKVAILAELRGALAVYRPAAFATVTGI